MEEVPQGSFQDELDWCISQLETGLLHLNPTPKQAAEETRRILGVLRSRKAPFVKKRQVMNQVFGDYRLKMAEERKRVAKAAMKPGKVQIQPGDALSSGSIVYRKQSGQPPETLRSRFAPSDNSFQFDFDLSESTPAGIDGTTGMDASEEQPVARGPFPQDDENGRLDFSTGAEMSGFAFNFVIPNNPSCPSVETDPGLVAAAEGAKDVDSPSSKTTVPDYSIFLNPDRSDALSGTRRDEACPTQGIPSLKIAQAVLPETKDSTEKEKKPVTGAGESCKKKKKKKRQPSKVEPSGSINGDSKHLGKGTSDEAEACQSDEQLKREVDWCVEQLELGLKTQKSTPKQKDEALRAIKTLRSGKAALPKKRQIMRAMFGDYRTKMAEEKRKQLKLMQAASVAARIAEVTEDTCRTSSQVFRKSAEAARRGQTQSCLLPPTPSTCPGTASPCSFVFTPSKEEFHFNFF